METGFGVVLPGMKGVDLLANLRKHSEVPVIMVIAMGGQSAKIGALRFGADDYVVKSQADWRLFQ